jgi:hypothetical protein
MAFQLQYPNPFDAADLATAYARVSQLNLNFDQQTGQVVVNVWATQAAMAGGRPPVGQLSLAVTPDGAGDSLSFTQLYKAAAVKGGDAAGTPAYDIVRRTLYQALKARPEFAAAQDV